MRHCLGNLLNILSLPSNSDTGNSRQINQSQVRAGVREDVQNNGDIYNSLVASAHFISEEVDLVSHF
jgi:hypothetical protein